MTHQEKLTIMFSDLGRRGVKRRIMAPWFYRVFWKMGIPLTPPHFASFATNALLMGDWFAGFMLFVWLLLFRDRNLSFSSVFLGAIWSGLLFGIMWGVYYRWQAHKFSLPNWRDYPSERI
jgi:hypothetical protein